MIILILPPEVSETIKAALRTAVKREVGGVLMGEHIGPDQFEVKELTVHQRGAIATFVRRIEDALGHLASFFERSKHDYTRFNYIGEWHSHPSFIPEPSLRDDASINEIVGDPKVGANFVVLLIVKLDAQGQLLGTAHTYLPDLSKHRSTVRFVL